MGRHKDADELEQAYAVLHNAGANLVGNTQASDLDWLARVLFESSNVGVGDVRTVPWVIGPQEWAELNLTRQSLMGDGPRRFDRLTPEQQEAWRKLARLVLWVLPCFAERVGSRFIEQAKALESLWRQEVKRV